MFNKNRAALRLVMPLVALSWLLAAPPVAAHAELEATFPQADAELAGPPAEVAAAFSEPIEANSTLELVGPDGTSVATGGLDPENPARLLLTVPDGLEPGAYEVEWQVFSADGHLERGTFEFTVTAAEPSPTPTAAPTATPTTAPTEETEAPTPEPTPTPARTDAPLPTASAAPGPDAAPTAGTDVILPIVAGLAVVALLALVLLRGRSRRQPPA